MTTKLPSLRLVLTLLGIFIFFLVSVVWLKNVYAPLTVAFVLAYLLDPIVEKLVRWKVPRELGVFLVLFIFFLVLGLVGMAIIPKLFGQARELISRLPQAYYNLTNWLVPYSQKYLGYNVFEDTDQFLKTFGDPTAVVRPISGIVQGVLSNTFRVVTGLLGLLIIPLMAFYLLKEYPFLYGKFLYVIPPRYHRVVSELQSRLDLVLGGFIRGQLVVSTILSVYYTVSFTVMGIQLSLVLGLMAGFFNIIPYLGISTVLVLTYLIALLHAASTGTLIGIGVVFAIGMVSEGSVLTPRIVGRKVGLSPLTLIVALLIGGELLGLVGMLLAVPIAAVGKVFLSFGLDRYRRSEIFQRGP